MSILDEANERVSDSAQAEYGEPTECLTAIAAVWTEGIRHKLNFELSGSDVALLMIGLKYVRLGNKYKRDSVIDLAGYARLMEIVNELRVVDAAQKQ